MRSFENRPSVVVVPLGRPPAGIHEGVRARPPVPANVIIEQVARSVRRSPRLLGHVCFYSVCFLPQGA